MNGYAQPDPSWIFLGSLAAVGVFVGLGSFAFSALLSAFGPRQGLVERIGRICFNVGIATLVFALVVHLALILTQQYAYNYVWMHTSSQLPTVYRFAAAWAGQEGSFLLWACMTGFIGAFILRSTGPYRRWYVVCLSTLLACLMGIIAYESPFSLITIDPVLLASLPEGVTMVQPDDGQGLNPVLQSPWMVIHPWIIFAGFGSLGALFAWSVSAAISSDWDDWVKRVRPLAIAAVALTGVGLVLGGIWAYETLGWGGFWAWDPVENVALVPWILCVVLMHGLYVQEHRKRWSRFNLVMAALPFMSFAWGTLLTRSGALTAVSVHSFARMDEGAHGILFWLVRIAILTLLFGTGFVIARRLTASDQANTVRLIPFTKVAIASAAVFSFVAIALALQIQMDPSTQLRWSVYKGFAWSLAAGLAIMVVGAWFGKSAAPASAQHRTQDVGHRTIAFTVGVILLLIPGLLAAVGSALPLYATIVSQNPRVVEEAVYNRSLGIFLVATLALMGVAPFLGWTKTQRERVSRIILSLAISLMLTVGAIFVLRTAGLTRPEGSPRDAMELILYEAIIAVGLFAIVSNSIRFLERLRSKSGNLGSFFAHVGIAMLLLGIIVSRAFGKSDFGLVAVGEPATIIGAEVSILQEPTQQELLTLENSVPFSVEWGGKNYTLRPVIFDTRTAMGDLQSVTRPDIHSTPFYDLYFSSSGMVTEYADEIRIHVGESMSVGEFEFTLEKLEVVGAEQGSEIIIVATMAVRNEAGDTRRFDVSRPVKDGRLAGDPVGVEFADFVEMQLTDIDFEDEAVTISIPYERPVFPVQLMFRPMTILVWIGTALATIGTLLAFRRK